jgi:hypothetical protein
MPSLFPGMDPYLEAADIWLDFYETFSSEVRAELNLLLPQPYYVRLEVRPEIGIVDGKGVSRRIVPDMTKVPEVGIEPTRDCSHGILSPARLPVPPLRH